MSDEIGVRFIEGSQNETIVKCHKKEKLNNVLNNYCKIKKINLNLDYLYFLYNGDFLYKHDTIITIDKLLYKSDRNNDILVIFAIDEVLISFSHVNDLYKKKIYIEEHIDNIFNDYLLEKKINRNDVIL